jgi:hypothetical protein
MLFVCLTQDEVTALHRACFGDNHQIVELLISYGAEVNGSTKEASLISFYCIYCIDVITVDCLALIYCPGVAAATSHCS